MFKCLKGNTKLECKLNAYEKILKQKNVYNNERFRKFSARMNNNENSISNIVDRIEFLNNTTNNNYRKKSLKYLWSRSLYGNEKFLTNNVINRIITQSYFTNNMKSKYAKKMTRNYNVIELVHLQDILPTNEIVKRLKNISPNNVMNRTFSPTIQTNAIQSYMKGKNKMNLFNVLNNKFIENPKFLKLLLSHGLKNITDLHVFNKKLRLKGNKPNKTELIKNKKLTSKQLNNILSEGGYIITKNDKPPNLNRTTVHGNNTYVIKAHGAYDPNNSKCFQVPKGKTFIFLAPLGEYHNANTTVKELKSQKISNKYTQGRWLNDIVISFSHPNNTLRPNVCGVLKIGKNLNITKNNIMRGIMTTNEQRNFSRKTFNALNQTNDKKVTQLITSDPGYKTTLSKLAKVLPNGIYYLTVCRGFLGVEHGCDKHKYEVISMRLEQNLLNRRP